MKYEIRLDWATMNFAAGQMDEYKVAKKLLGQIDIGFRKTGLNEGSPLNSPLGLRWMANSGFAEMPHKLEVRGVGCEHFALTLPALRAAAPCRFSRLDFAFDCVMKREEWKDYICKCFQASMYSDRERKKFCLQGSGEAMTIYIGSRRCAKFFRIYNKTLEDSKYKYCVDGEEIEISEDECVIRYEVELHRFKDSKHLYDPSPLFDWYYDPEKWDELSDYIKKLWLSYGDEVMLPPDFESIDFLPRIATNKNFVESREPEQLLIAVSEKLHEYPRSFERTLQYVTEKFGKYIPYIIADNDYRVRCYADCNRAFGFAPEVYFENMTPTFYELDDLEEPDFIALDGDQLQLDY